MRYLDDEDLPFTTDELRQAATMWLGKKKGEDLTGEIVESVPGYVASREERRAELFQRGDIDEIFRAGAYNIPNELLAFISTLSEEAATRIEVLLVKRWSLLRDMYIGEALGKLAVTSGADRPRGNRRRKAPRSAPHGTRGDHRLPTGSLPPLPPSLVNDAEARLRVDVAHWRSLVESARQGEIS